MRATIFYFSATGNSLHAAKAIAGKLGECELVAIPGLRAEKTVAAVTELVGFVFPMHYFGLPPLIRNLLATVKLKENQYAFAVVTSGSGRYLSSTLWQADRILAQKGKKLDAGFHVGMISSYIPLSDIPPADKMHKKLAQADEKLAAIAGAVLSKQKMRETEPLWMPCAAINTYWRKNMLPKTHRKFSCTASCTSCGICEKICPVTNIRLVDGKPQWSADCQECLACLHFCPAKSIEFGGNTVSRKRYHHPQVEMAEMMER